MSGFAFDANILIDALGGFPQALEEIRRARRVDGRAWISRMVWVEVLSKGLDEAVIGAERFLSTFGMDELDEEIASQASTLRRARPRLKSPDAIILASAQRRGRTLVTRNIKDFPATMPGIRVPYLI